MDWMISIAQLLLSLSILVAVHEFGHLLAAKYFGMRVEQFSIGFPPKIISFRKGETEYALSAIPLGGYVKISGMIDESLDTESMQKEPQPWEFRSKPAWQRLIVMLGGIFVNVIIGILIFISLTFFYGDTYLLKDVINANGGFYAGPIGRDVGFQSGDKIIKINGQDYQYFEDLINPATLLDESTYTVERNGQTVSIEVPIEVLQEINKNRRSTDFLSPRPTTLVGMVAEGMIGEKVGLKEGDIITEVNGYPVTYYDEASSHIRQIHDGMLTFKIRRDGKLLSFEEKVTKDTLIGFQPMYSDKFLKDAEHRITYGFIESVPLGVKKAFSTLMLQVRAFGKIISGKLSASENLSGPIGIAKAFGDSWDWERFWTITGVLSLVLAFMNLLPIPALDGGHVAFLTYEMVSGRKPSDKFLETAQKVGMVILLALMVFVIANDIIKL